MAKPKAKKSLEQEIEAELASLMASSKNDDDKELRLKVLDRAIKWERSKQGSAGSAFDSPTERENDDE